MAEITKKKYSAPALGMALATLTSWIGGLMLERYLAIVIPDPVLAAWGVLMMMAASAMIPDELEAE